MLINVSRVYQQASRLPRLWILVLPPLVLISSCLSKAENQESSGLPEGQYIYVEAPPDTSLDRASGWDFEFREGQYVFNRDGMVVFEGQYTSSGDSLLLSGERGLPWAACDPANDPGIYSWRLEGDHLLVSVVSDMCERRSRQLTLSQLAPGASTSPETVRVPQELQGAWNSFFGLGRAGGDARVAALSSLLTDDAQFMSVNGKAAALAFAADFFCATGGRKPISPNYQRFGPCQPANSEGSESRPFLFDIGSDRIRERGTYITRLFRDSTLVGTGVGRYEVTWTRDASGFWKIARMVGA